MNRKAMQLAISTLILILLGIILLVAVIVALTGGFDRLTQTTDPFEDSAQASAVKQTCTSACEQESRIIYCCAEYTINEETITCNDPRLELDCQLDCTDFDCGEE